MRTNGVLIVVGLAIAAVGAVAWLVAKPAGGPGESGDARARGSDGAQGAAPSRPGSDAESDLSPDDRALAELRAELSRAAPVAGRSDADRLADARAWVAAHRDPDRPYNEVEAKILALMDVLGEGSERSAEWMMNMSQVEVEMIRALDADSDGQVSDAEVQRFIDENIAGMFDPTSHPYLMDRFDADGDGEVGPEEMMAMASAIGDGALAGLWERGRLESWDANNDGLLSDAERSAGTLAAARTARDTYAAVLGEAADLLLPDPDASPDQQAAAQESLLAGASDEQLRMIEVQREMMLSQVISQELLEAMRLDNLPSPEVKDIIDQMPQPPDPMSFDADGDGSLAGDEVTAQSQAIADYQADIQQWGNELTARRLREQFDNSIAQSDADGDGRMNPGEWDARIADLITQREQRLMLRSYDLDANGHIDGHEMVTFLKWYRDGSLRADVNYDGQLNALDLEAMGARSGR